MSINTCEHHDCRCARSRELAAIYDRTGQGRYLREAIDVHEQRVVCRRAEDFEPRKKQRTIQHDNGSS
jgi:hypothetical protein